jgi:lipopolysaccharide export system protein LptA
VPGRYCTIFLLLAILAAAPFAHAGPTPKAPFELDPSEPIKLAADRVSFDNKAMTVRWEGNVVAMQRDVKMSAALVVLQFEKKAGDQVDGQIPMFSGSGEISSITATGSVKMMQGERRAVCEKVVFNQKADNIIFSGSPRIFSGSDSLSGEKIIVHIKDQRVEVAGSPGRRVTATVMPKGEDGFLPAEAKERMEELEKNPPPDPEPFAAETKPDKSSTKSDGESLRLEEPTP